MYIVSTIDFPLVDRTVESMEAALIRVASIVSTIGFPLVGGPAGSMEAGSMEAGMIESCYFTYVFINSNLPLPSGRDVPVAKALLGAKDIPYIIAAPLLLQEIRQWKKQGVMGLQSVVLYSLPELDGAVDTVVLGGLAADRIGLIPEVRNK
ncbi:hypothetical protein T492DRAFT_833042 [Pavlovales sp. CCMP2436]|nr:hypothetical protein T492DRAFT_833042 [Pavlovales sp. CCMP2436]